MFETLYFFSYILSLIVIIALLLFLVMSRKKTKEVTSFIYTLAVTSLWMLLAVYGKFFVSDENLAIIIWKIYPIATLLLTAVLLRFLLYFLKVKLNSVVQLILGLLFLISIYISLFTDKVVTGISKSTYGDIIPTIGSFTVYQFLIIGIFLGVSAWLLLNEFFKSEGERKKHIMYMFLGLILVFVVSIVTELLLPVLEIQFPYMSNLSIAIFVVLVFYLIYMHEVFNLGNVKIRIGHKVFLGILVASLAPIAIIYGINASSYNDVLLEKTLSESNERISGHSIQISSRFERYKDEILFLSETPSLAGMIRAEDTGIDPVTGLTYLELREFLEGTFVSLAKTTSAYIQIRYIDENGNEIVRVNSEDLIVEVVPVPNLQDKSDRYYFIESVDKPIGYIYSSSLDLNREGGVIETPYKPVIRYATPIHSNLGSKKGILILNVFDNEIFNILNTGEENDILLNSDGFYIFHNNKSKEWGGPRDLDTGENIFIDYPEIGSEILSGNKTSFIHNDEVFTYEKILVNKNTGHHLIILEILDRDLLLAPLDRLRSLTLISIFISLIVVLFLSYVISKFITNPISKLYKNIISIQEGEINQGILISSKDEVGELAKVFSELIDSVREARGSIELKVNEQTKSIENQKIKIEEQRAAVLNILDDVSTEKEIASIERDKLDTTLKSIGDAVFVVDKDYKVTLFNKAAEDISGFTQDEILGKRYDDVLKFFMEDTKEVSNQFITDAVEKGISGVMANHTKLIMKNGVNLSVADSAAPIKNVQGEIIGGIVVFRDVTKEEAIDKAKSEFVSTASHQLRTPLVGVRWVVDRFIKKEKLSKEGEGYLRDIQKAMTRLAALVDGLLNVSRIESAGGIAVLPEKFELVHFIEDYMDENRPYVAKKSIKFTFTKHPDEMIISTDKNVFRNILQSLVSNALEYTLENGEVEIILKDKGTQFQLCIRDTGIGIPKDEHETIFNKFSRAQNAQLLKTDGTGLGLYIAKEATNVLGGEIVFESEENKGTIFYVTLPKESERKEGEKKLT